MAIKVSCPSCQKAYNLGDAQAGQKVRCKDCAHVFEAQPAEEAIAEVAPKARASVAAGKRANPDVRDEEDDRPAKRPARPARDEDEDDRPSRRPARASRDEDEDDRPKRRSSRDEDEDDRPRRASKAKGGIPLWVWLVGGGGLGFFMLLGMGVVVWLVFSGPSITMDNYNKIKTRMTEAEAIAIMGKPTQTADANKAANVAGAIFGKDLNRGMPQLKTLTWKSGDNFISVGLVDGKVVSKTIQLNGTTMSEMGF